MSDYFVLRSLPSIEAEGVDGYMEIEDWHDVAGFENWGVGLLAEQRPTGEVEMPAVPHDGFAGPPDDFQDMSVPLMSKRLRQAIESAGVDNIEFHPVTVRNTQTGEAYEYFAFNLLGLVAAAGPATKMSSHDGDFIGDTQVYDLAIDESRARGLLMFRLKEKFTVILVHRKVKQAIERAGIGSVTFVKPEDFMAL
jgi:hypothetical protein